ncbi:MAG: pyrroline-5-carboxylate reductase, partial [Clostridia bacterium]
FIGAGNMGGTIMKSAFQCGFLKPYETMVYDVNESAMKELGEQFPITVAQSNTQLAKECECIVLAIKPIFMRGVLDEIQKYVRNKRIISIAAGWTMEMLTDALGKDNGSQVLRVMSNMPALIGAGFTALCEETSFTKPMIKWAKELFSYLGTVQILPERLFDAVVAVSGSSPAYVFMMIEAMADGAVKLGMPRSLAIQAAAQAVLGSAKMVLDTNEHPASLKDKVCSPGGTTIEAVEVLEKGGFRGLMMEAMDVCAQKNRRMAAASAQDRRKC